jgi:hypothetical protein
MMTHAVGGQGGMRSFTWQLSWISNEQARVKIEISVAG